MIALTIMERQPFQLFLSYIGVKELLLMYKSAEFEEIIIGCQKNDDLSQLKLYELFYTYGLTICSQFSADKNEANQMLNNSFLKVFTKFNQYNLDFPFRPWFKAILINASIDYRRRKKMLLLEAIEAYEQDLIQNNTIEEKLIYEDLINLIQKLSPACRNAFSLFVIEGYKHYEIAEMLNITVGTSKSNLAKAKKKLRSLIEEIY